MCVCALPPWPNLAIGTLRAEGPPLLANLQIGQKRKNNATRRANWNHIATALTSLPLRLPLPLSLPAPHHHIWETWRGLEKKWNDFFSLVCPPLFPLWGLLSLSLPLFAPWRLNVIFYSYLFIKARKAARTDWIVTDLTAGPATPPPQYTLHTLYALSTCHSKYAHTHIAKNAN